MKSNMILFVLTIFLAACVTTNHENVRHSELEANETLYFGRVVFHPLSFEEGAISKVGVKNTQKTLVESFRLCFWLHEDLKLQCFLFEGPYYDVKSYNALPSDSDQRLSPFFSFKASPQSVSLKSANVIRPAKYDYEFKAGKFMVGEVEESAVFLGDLLVYVGEPSYRRSDSPRVSYFSGCESNNAINHLRKIGYIPRDIMVSKNCFDIGEVIHTKSGAVTISEGMKDD